MQPRLWPQAVGDHEKLYARLHLHCGKKWGFVGIKPKQTNAGKGLLRRTHLGKELVKRHDRPKEEEWEVEVVLEEIKYGVDALFLLSALKCKAHAAHDGEPTSSIEKNILKIKSSRYKPALDEKLRVTTRNMVSLLCALPLWRLSFLGHHIKPLIML